MNCSLCNCFVTQSSTEFSHRTTEEKIFLLLLHHIKTLAVFVLHQGIDFQFTVVPKLYQGSAAKRGVIVWRAPFLFLFWRSKKEKRPAAGVGKARSKKVLR